MMLRMENIEEDDEKNDNVAEDEVEDDDVGEAEVEDDDVEDDDVKGRKMMLMTRKKIMLRRMIMRKKRS